MTYSKTIVCLANSKKFSGRCVAGIELSHGQLQGWIRPVSDREGEELSIDERRYENGNDVAVLDVVRIEFMSERPHACQVENHVIDDSAYWQLEGRFSAKDLVSMAQTKPPLWIDGYSSYSGLNDRIPVEQADKLTSSLTLVLATNPTVQVGRGLKKRQVRVEFTLGKTPYRLGVTEPGTERHYLSEKDGAYPLNSRVLLCVSLGEPWDGFRYKLAASMLQLDGTP